MEVLNGNRAGCTESQAINFLGKARIKVLGMSKPGVLGEQGDWQGPSVTGGVCNWGSSGQGQGRRWGFTMQTFFHRKLVKSFK